MCQMSMKLPDMFDQNPPNTIDKIVAKHIPIKKQSQTSTSVTNNPNDSYDIWDLV